MDFQRAALALCVATVAYTWYKRRRTHSISDVPGPKNPSWIYGIPGITACEMALSHTLSNRSQVVVGM